MGTTLLLKTNYSIDDTKSVVSEAFEKQIDFVHSRFIKFDSECKEFETKYVSVHGFKGSAPPLTAEAASLIEKETPALRSHIRGVQGSRFNSRPRSAFGLRIYEKSVSFVRPNPKFGAKLVITWENEHF